MATVLDRPSNSPEQQKRIPPLESGDRLTRAEFERRYTAMPQTKKAELIEGVVYMGTPVSLLHGIPHTIVMNWLGAYWADTPSVRCIDNTTVRLDEDNEPQPDAALFILPEFGGAAKVGEDNYLSGSPELIVEIASSSATYDLREKLVAYRRNQPSSDTATLTVNP